MINIARSSVAVPRVLTDRNGPGVLETSRAQKYFRKRKRCSNFPFAAYRDQEVKAALERLFHRKCAYCESRYVATQPIDVEHWRPKAAVQVPEQTRNGQVKMVRRLGYYWLAAEWTNLLPSCIDCNRARGQIELPSGEKRLLGKGDRFPLRDETKRAKKPGMHRNEKPLLLNPCVDDPAQHLEHIGDAVFAPRPRGKSRRISERGRTSIEIYALNRTGLVQGRQELLRQIEAQAYTIQQLVLLLDRKSRGSVQNRIEDLLSRQMSGLIRFMEPDQPYSFMAKQVVESFLRSLTSKGVGDSPKETNRLKRPSGSRQRAANIYGRSR